MASVPIDVRRRFDFLALDHLRRSVELREARDALRRTIHRFLGKTKVGELG